MSTSDDAVELEVKDLPESVDEELASAAWDDGPEPPGADPADGRTLFDTPRSEAGSVLVIFPQEKFPAWRAQALAHIASADGRVYLAQVAGGPYAAPNGLPSDAPMLLATQIEGALFTPPYHGWVAMTILGEVVEGGLAVPLQRPRPNSPVRLLDPLQTRAALRCDGDLRLGRAVGHPDLDVGLRGDEKHHVPRHTLVVGTTGAGKSTALAGLIEKLAASGFCVLVLDVEGEYSAIGEPADSAKILPSLRARGLEPAGVPNTFLLVPTDAEVSHPEHPKIRRFSLQFEHISPFIAAEILQGNEAQTDRFLAAYDAAGELLTQWGLVPDRAAHQQALRQWDDQEAGYPDLRLAHVLDLAEAVAALAAGEDAIAERYLHDDGFRGHVAALLEKAGAVKKRIGHAASWRKTVGLIASLHRTGLFDRSGQQTAQGKPITSLDYERMVKPGHVLIFDLAGID
ncbi:MAG TPA: helicase HerA-like domain-containing protein, partial [Isosphaeraceae bacterium]